LMRCFACYHLTNTLVLEDYYSLGKIFSDKNEF